MALIFFFHIFNDLGQMYTFLSTFKITYMWDNLLLKMVPILIWLGYLGQVAQMQCLGQEFASQDVMYWELFWERRKQMWKENFLSKIMGSSRVQPHLVPQASSELELCHRVGLNLAQMDQPSVPLNPSVIGFKLS